MANVAKFVNHYLDASMSTGKKSYKKSYKKMHLSIDTKKAQKRNERRAKRLSTSVSSIDDQISSTNMYKKAINHVDDLYDSPNSCEDFKYESSCDETCSYCYPQARVLPSPHVSQGRVPPSTPKSANEVNEVATAVNTKLQKEELRRAKKEYYVEKTRLKDELRKAIADNKKEQKLRDTYYKALRFLTFDEIQILIDTTWHLSDGEVHELVALLQNRYNLDIPLLQEVDKLITRVQKDFAAETTV